MAGSSETRKTRSSSSSSSSRSSKRRASGADALKEDEEVAASASRSPAAKTRSAERTKSSDSEADRELVTVQSVDRVRRKKKTLRDKAMEQSRSNSERQVRKKRQKADGDGGEERRTRSKASDSKKDSRKSSLTPTGSVRMDQPSKSKSTPPTKEAIDMVKAVISEEAEDQLSDDAEKADTERGVVSEQMAAAQLEVDRDTVELVGKMQTHMESLEEALRVSQEENKAMLEKMVQMNIDLRDVQLQVKKLNKQHADEVIDRFKQYERLFSTSILTVQSAAEKCVATVQVGVKEAVEAVLAEHKESLAATLRENLETVSAAGAEHVEALKKQLAEEMEQLSAKAAAQHEALAASLGESASRKVQPDEITRKLLLTLVEQTFAAMGGPDDYEDSEEDTGEDAQASDAADRGAADAQADGDAEDGSASQEAA